MAADAVVHALPEGRLLVAAPARLDDACFSVPAVRALARSERVAALALLCAEAQAPLWRRVGGVEVIAFPDRAGPRAIRALLAGAADRFAAALAWEPSAASRALRAAGIRRRFGPAGRQLAGQLSDPVTIARRPGPAEHRVRDFLLVAGALGADPFNPHHFAPAAAPSDPPAGALLVVPDSDFGPSHAWPAEGWLEVLRPLADDHGLRPTILDHGCGPLAAAVATALGDRAAPAEARQLDAQLDVLAAHRFVAGVDGTIPHLAALLGATCTVLFGPGEPAWRRPLGKRHSILRRHVECSPCLRATCPLDHRCMRELDAARVRAAVDAMLAPARAGQA